MPSSDEQHRIKAMKPRFELVDPAALLALAMVLTSGAKKYGDQDWRRIRDSRVFVGSAHRHLNQAQRGLVVDPESALPHSVHLMANAMFLTSLDLQGFGMEQWEGWWRATQTKKE